MLFFCHSKILHKRCLQFLLGVKMAPQNLGWQTKSIMVCYGISWIGQQIRRSVLTVLLSLLDTVMLQHRRRQIKRKLKNDYFTSYNTKIIYRRKLLLLLGSRLSNLLFIYLFIYLFVSYLFISSIYWPSCFKKWLVEVFKLYLKCLGLCACMFWLVNKSALIILFVAVWCC